MLEIFKAQTEYLAFLSGLGFAFLSLLWFALARLRQAPPIFFWLALFGLAQWGYQWFAMLSPIWPNKVLQDCIKPIVLIVSVSLLGGGGLSMMLPMVRLATGMLMLGLGLGWLIGLFGNINFFGIVIFSGGIGCGLLAARALRLLAREKQAVVLNWVALALMGYGLAMPLTLPMDYFSLLRPIPELLGSAGGRVTLVILQVLGSCLMAMLMWSYYRQEVWRQTERKNISEVNPVIRTTWFVPAICAILLGGGVATGLFGLYLEAEMREELASRARTLAAALAPEAVKQLTASEADLANPNYQSLKRQLQAIRAANTDCRFLYLLDFRHQNVVFLMDSEPETSRDYSPPGQIYHEATPVLKSMATAPRPFLEGPEPDRWGIWVTAFDVIKEAATGKPLALVGLDIDAGDWQSKIALYTLLPISITFLMILLLTGFFISQETLLSSTQQIAESEERYRSLVEGSPNGICLFDREGRCLAINRNGSAMLGVQEAEILEKPFQDHCSRNQQPRVAAAFDEVKTGRLVNFEVEMHRFQGEPCIWEVILNPIRGQHDVYLGCVAILTDVTEQRQAEEELRTSRALLQSLLDSIPDLLMVIDRDYRIVYSNNQGDAFLQPLVGAMAPTCYQGLYQQPAPCPDCPIPGVFASGRSVEQERINPEDGRISEVRIFPIFAADGQVMMVIYHVRDITERKRVEEALRTRQAKLDTIFRAAPVGIGLVVERAFKEVNDQFCLMTGYSREELLGKSSRLLYASQEEFEQVGREKYRQIAEQGKGSIETRWQTRDGAVIDVLLSSAPLFGTAQPQEILFTALDITERKKLESARYTIDKMESLGIMAGGIAHDFNNVLVGILGNISLMGLASTAAETRERLGDAEQGCRQAILLAKQLLTFAKGGVPVKEPADLRLVVQEAARLALSGSRSKTVFSFPDDLWSVEVDHGQMHQVFANLLINADQAMPLGGRIDIRAENLASTRVQAPNLAPGRYVLVTVTDQGVGIPPEQMDKIFDPYFSTKQKGSGLGLTTAYSIVKNHGGLITCESKLGQGTTFFVYLPALEHSLKIPSPADKKIFSGHGRILVLEDDDRVQAVMARMLVKLGYECVFAHEGSEALGLFAQARQTGQPFDLVILDLTIPGGMGGLETLQGLLAQDDQIKAIVSSGYADDPVLARYRDFGFCGVITKPYRIEDLSEVLHKVMS